MTSTENFMFNDKPRRESLYHCAILSNTETEGIRTIKVSRASNKKLRKLLETHISLESTFYTYKPKSLFTEFADPITKFPGFEKALKDLDHTNFEFGIITINDEEYPETLRRYEDAPPVLYYRGNLELLKKPSMVVIGSRNLKDPIDIEEGTSFLERLISGGRAKELTNGEGYCIVSGLALGCDTLAHQIAIEFSGDTIAVVGKPLDIYYPEENKELQEHIANNQLLLSQFPIGYNLKPRDGFVERNYTVACLSTHGVGVIRAADRSGTLHAVRHCVQQEKPLYVLENNMNQGHRWTEEYKDKIRVIKSSFWGKEE